MKRHITLVLGALLLVGLAGCSSAADPTGGGAAEGSTKEAVLKYAQCMRENGVPDFQDPKFDENGEIEDLSLPKGVDEETAEGAHEKCAKYLPNGGGAPEKMNAEDLAKFQEYAKCMRENGVPEFPDPDSNGRLRVDGIDMTSAEYQAANEKCQHLTPGSGGVQFSPEEEG